MRWTKPSLPINKYKTQDPYFYLGRGTVQNKNPHKPLSISQRKENKKFAAMPCSIFHSPWYARWKARLNSWALGSLSEKSPFLQFNVEKTLSAYTYTRGIHLISKSTKGGVQPLPISTRKGDWSFPIHPRWGD